jgi:ubiquinone/menaquinone biosynthesis C-methylase UbiE
MNLLQKLADNENKSSLANRLRKNRFSFFLSLLEQLPKPIKILDVGGTSNFWDQMNFFDPDIQIHLLNTTPAICTKSQHISVVGDARDMCQYADYEFDVVFSNSVIEHVGEFVDQQKMANEIRRVGKRYFLQTPNYYFPIEPHFLVPCFQFMPTSLQILLARNFNLGWSKKAETKESAYQLVKSVELLTEKELRTLFPSAKIYREKFLGLTKSLIAYDGWENV